VSKNSGAPKIVRGLVLGLVMVVGFVMLLIAGLSAIGGRGTSATGTVGAILFVGAMIALGQSDTHDRLDAIRELLKRR